MAAIRPLDRADLPAVGALMADHLLQRPLPGRDTQAFLTATLLDHPWTDPELPSLVGEDEDGRIVGFIAAQPRRFRVDGRPVRAVLCSHLVVAPEARTGALGVQLVRRLLAGPQDLTWSDTGVDVVVRLFAMAGGHADHGRAADWMLVLRPARWAAAIARGSLRDRHVGRTVMPAGGLPVQAAGRRLVRRAFPPAAEGLESTPLTPAEAVAHLAEAADRTRLVPDYDVAHLTATLALAGAQAGDIVGAVVRRRGRVVGWFVVEHVGATGRVLQLVSSARHAPAVLDAVLADARQRGIAVLSGRLEPHLHEALAPRLPVIGLARSPIIHARDPDVRDAVGAGSALITRLDGEWWVL